MISEYDLCDESKKHNILYKVIRGTEGNVERVIAYDLGKNVKYNCVYSAVPGKFAETRESCVVSAWRIYDKEYDPGHNVIALVKGIMFPAAKRKKMKQLTLPL